jgi:EAL domain-containing protein (putative c-di-GMP-specific phosphodiesterase class I)
MAVMATLEGTAPAVGLARSFDIKTVAEWVSSEDDAALLQNFGVDYFQGFHFGQPIMDPTWD